MARIGLRQRMDPTGTLNIAGEVPGGIVSMGQKNGVRSGIRTKFDPNAATPGSVISPIDMGQAQQGFRTSFTEGTATDIPRAATMGTGESAAVIPQSTVDARTAEARNRGEHLTPAARAGRIQGNIDATNNVVVNGKNAYQERVEPVLNAEQAAASQARTAQGNADIRGGFRSPMQREEDRYKDTVGLRQSFMATDLQKTQAAGAAEMGKTAIEAQGRIDAAAAGNKPLGTQAVAFRTGKDTQGVAVFDKETGQEIIPPTAQTDSYAMMLDKMQSGKGLFNLEGLGAGEKQKLDSEWVATTGRPVQDAPHRQGNALRQQPGTNGLRQPTANLPTALQQQIQDFQQKAGREITEQELQIALKNWGVAGQ